MRDRKAEQLANDEEALRLQERSLPDDQLLAYRQEINRRIKDPDTYATLVYVFGFGLHHLYLGRLAFFLIDLLCGLTFWISLLGYIFYGEGLPISITLLAIGYNIYDTVKCLFFSQNIVREYNLNMGQKIITRHRQAF